MRESPDEEDRKKARERKRRERERKRRERERDEFGVWIVVSRKSRDVLVDARWLGEWDEDDREAVREAVQKLIDGIAPVTRDASG